MQRARHASGIALLGLALLAGGCGGDEEAEAPDATTAPANPAPPADDAGRDEAGGAPETRTAEVYFTAGEQFRAVERDLPTAGSTEEDLAAASEALIAGPTRSESATDVGTTSQIPTGTAVREVSLAADGTATVSVSPRFTRGIPADPGSRSRAQDSELDARLAQVTYTLTGIPGVKAAKVVAGGATVEPATERDDLARPERGPKRLERAGGKGERGASIRTLQERLAELRYLPPSAVDGVDGYRTRQAVIAFQSWRGLQRDGIVGPATTRALAKASPPSPKGDGPSRRIEVFNEKGVALLVRGDETVRAIHVSTGGAGNETPTGRYSVFRKELMSWSVPFQTWLPFASYFNNGIAFHEYADVPTYPASHGCVRVPVPEAKGVYRFARLDTAVVVF